MWANRFYYNLKPFIPRSLRIRVRQWWANRRRRQFTHTWPIFPGSEKTPAGWPGWPEGKEFAFVLTHDVESKEGLEKCRDLMDLEMSMGFRSSFNFIPEGDYRVSRELREMLKSNGFEVGLHDLEHDGKLYLDREGFKSKAQKINGYLKEWEACGFRSGFMFHNLDWLRHLNIKYDASTFDTDPFEPQPDGAQTIFPFWVKGAIGVGEGYVELPYTLVQDSTLFLHLQEPTNEIWRKKLDWIARHGGMALMNIHPDYMAFGAEDRGPYKYPVEFYRDFLDYVRTRYAGRYWAALPRTVADWHVRNVRKNGEARQATVEN